MAKVEKQTGNDLSKVLSIVDQIQTNEPPSGPTGLQQFGAEFWDHMAVRPGLGALRAVDSTRQVIEEKLDGFRLERVFDNDYLQMFSEEYLEEVKGLVATPTDRQHLLTETIQVIEEDRGKKTKQGKLGGSSFGSFAGAFAGGNVSLPGLLVWKATGPLVGASKVISPALARGSMAIGSKLGLKPFATKALGKLVELTAREATVGGIGLGTYMAFDEYAVTGDPRAVGLAAVEGAAVGTAGGVVLGGLLSGLSKGGKFVFQSIARGTKAKNVVKAPRVISKEEYSQVLNVPKDPSEDQVLQAFKKKSKTVQTQQEFDFLVEATDEVLSSIGSTASSKGKPQRFENLAKEFMEELDPEIARELKESPSTLHKYLNSRSNGLETTVVRDGSDLKVVSLGADLESAVKSSEKLAQKVSESNVKKTKEVRRSQLKEKVQKSKANQKVKSTTIEVEPDGTSKVRLTEPAKEKVSVVKTRDVGMPVEQRAYVSLPRELSGANPRWKDSILEWESDIDKALYIVTGKGQSKRHNQYKQWLKSIGLNESQIKQRGAQVRNTIKRRANGYNGEVLKVPAIVEVPKLPDFSRQGGYVTSDFFEKPIIAIGKGIAGLGRGAISALEFSTRWPRASSVELVRAVNTRGARQIANLGEEVINDWKNYRGKFEPGLEEVNKRIYGVLKRNKDLRSWFASPAGGFRRLDSLNDVEIGYYNLRQAMEGLVDLSTLPEGMADIIESLQKLVYSTGEATQDAGILRRVGKKQYDDNVEYFSQQPFEVLLEQFEKISRGRTKLPENEDQATDFLIDVLSTWTVATPTPGGRSFPQMPTVDMLDTILRKGDLYDTLVKVIALTNKAADTPVGEAIKQVRGTLDNIISSESSLHRLSLEFTRQWRNTPSIIKSGGKTLQLFQFDPHLIAESMVDLTSSRIAFVKRFGQGIAALEKSGDSDTILEGLKKMAVLSGVKPAHFDHMIGDLSRTPRNKPFVDPGSKLGGLVRAHQNLQSIYVTNLLTRAQVVQLPEIAGNIQSMGGARNTIKALFDLADNEGRESAVAELKRLGILSDDFVNLVSNPERQIETFVQRYGDVGTKYSGTRFAWKMQEVLSGMVGSNLVKELKEGSPGWGNKEKNFFRMKHLLGFTERQARELVEGTAKEELYEQVIRRFASRSNITQRTHPAESPTIRQFRIFQKWFPLMSYTLMKTQTLSTHTKGLWEEWGRFYTRKDKKSAMRLLGAVRQNARFHVGNVMQGIGTHFIVDSLMHGVRHPMMKLHALTASPEPVHPIIQELTIEDDEQSYMGRFFDYFTDQWIGSMFGPLTWITRKAIEERDPLQFVGLSLTYNMTEETFSFLASVGSKAGSKVPVIGGGLNKHGFGRYEGLTIPEMTLKYLENQTTVSEPFKRLVALTGISERDLDMEAAIKVYNEFERQSLGNRSQWRSGPTLTRDQERRRELRLLMNRAYQHLKTGTPTESASEEVRNAIMEMIYVEGTSPDHVADVLRARKLTSGLKAEAYPLALRWFKQRDAMDLWELVLKHDAILDEWIESVQSSN